MVAIAEFKGLKEKLNAFFEEIEEELALEDKSTEAWKPSEGEVYCSLLYSGDIRSFPWDNDTWDNDIMVRGLAFKTKEQAELADKKRIIHKKLVDVAGNGGEFVCGVTNHTIAYDEDDDAFFTSYYTGARYFGAVYSQDTEFLARALDQIGEDDLKLYMGIDS